MSGEVPQPLPRSNPEKTNVVRPDPEPESPPKLAQSTPVLARKDQQVSLATKLERAREAAKAATAGPHVSLATKLARAREAAKVAAGDGRPARQVTSVYGTLSQQDLLPTRKRGISQSLARPTKAARQRILALVASQDYGADDLSGASIMDVTGHSSDPGLLASVHHTTSSSMMFPGDGGSGGQGSSIGRSRSRDNIPRELDPLAKFAPVPRTPSPQPVKGEGGTEPRLDEGRRHSIDDIDNTSVRDGATDLPPTQSSARDNLVSRGRDRGATGAPGPLTADNNTGSSYADPNRYDDVRPTRDTSEAQLDALLGVDRDDVGGGGSPSSRGGDGNGNARGQRAGSDALTGWDRGSPAPVAPGVPHQGEMVTSRGGEQTSLPRQGTATKSGNSDTHARTITPRRTPANQSGAGAGPNSGAQNGTLVVSQDSPVSGPATGHSPLSHKVSQGPGDPLPAHQSTAFGVDQRTDRDQGGAPPGGPQAIPPLVAASRNATLDSKEGATTPGGMHLSGDTDTPKPSDTDSKDGTNNTPATTQDGPADKDGDPKPVDVVAGTTDANQKTEEKKGEGKADDDKKDDEKDKEPELSPEEQAKIIVETRTHHLAKMKKLAKMTQTPSEALADQEEHAAALAEKENASKRRKTRSETVDTSNRAIKKDPKVIAYGWGRMVKPYFSVTSTRQQMEIDTAEEVVDPKVTARAAKRRQRQQTISELYNPKTSKKNKKKKDKSIDVSNPKYQTAFSHPAQNVPTRIDPAWFEGEVISKVSFIQHSMLFLTESGTVYAMGYYEDGITNPITSTWLDHPTRVLALGTRVVIDIKHCRTHTVAVVKGEVGGQVLTWGLNDEGNLGHGDFREQRSPKPVNAFREMDALKCTCTDNFTAVVTKDNKIWTCGSNEEGQLGHEVKQATGVSAYGRVKKEKTKDPKGIPSFKELDGVTGKIADIICGQSHLTWLTFSGEVYNIGSGKGGVLGHGCPGGMYIDLVNGAEEKEDTGTTKAEANEEEGKGKGKSKGKGKGQGKGKGTLTRRGTNLSQSRSPNSSRLVSSLSKTPATTSRSMSNLAKTTSPRVTPSRSESKLTKSRSKASPSGSQAKIETSASTSKLSKGFTSNPNMVASEGSTEASTGLIDTPNGSKQDIVDAREPEREAKDEPVVNETTSNTPSALPTDTETRVDTKDPVKPSDGPADGKEVETTKDENDKKDGKSEKEDTTRLLTVEEQVERMQETTPRKLVVKREVVQDDGTTKMVAEKFRMITCGPTHVMALCASGTIYTWGMGENGELGVVTKDPFHATPTPLAPLYAEQSVKDIVSLGCGYAHSCAVTVDGDIYMWGRNGEWMGLYQPRDIPTPMRNEYLRVGVVAVYCGFDATITLCKSKKVKTVPAFRTAAILRSYMRHYTDGLKELFKAYVDPLRAAAKLSMPIIPRNEINYLFRNFDELVLHVPHFKDDVDELLKNWRLKGEDRRYIRWLFGEVLDLYRPYILEAEFAHEKGLREAWTHKFSTFCESVHSSAVELEELMAIPLRAFVAFYKFFTQLTEHMGDEEDDRLVRSPSKATLERQSEFTGLGLPGSMIRARLEKLALKAAAEEEEEENGAIDSGLTSLPMSRDPSRVMLISPSASRANLAALTEGEGKAGGVKKSPSRTNVTHMGPTSTGVKRSSSNTGLSKNASKSSGMGEGDDNNTSIPVFVQRPPATHFKNSPSLMSITSEPSELHNDDIPPYTIAEIRSEFDVMKGICDEILHKIDDPEIDRAQRKTKEDPWFVRKVVDPVIRLFGFRAFENDYKRKAYYVSGVFVLAPFLIVLLAAASGQKGYRYTSAVFLSFFFIYAYTLMVKSIWHGRGDPELIEISHPATKVRPNIQNGNEILNMFIELFQLTSFSINADMPWNDDGGQTKVFQYSTFPRTGDTFPAVLALFIIGIAAWIVIQKIFRKGEDKFPKLYKIYSFVLPAFFTGPLYMVLLASSFSFVDCSYPSGAPAYLDVNPKVECWTGLHIFHALIALIGFGLYFPIATLTPYHAHSEFLSPKRDIRYVPLYIICVQFSKAFLTLVSTFFNTRSFLVIPVTLLVNVALLVSTILVRPSCIAVINWVRVGLYSMVSWSALMAALTVILDDPSSLVPTILLLVGWIIIIAVLVFARRANPNRLKRRDVGAATHAFSIQAAKHAEEDERQKALPFGDGVVETTGKPSKGGKGKGKRKKKKVKANTTKQDVPV